LIEQHVNLGISLITPIECLPELLLSPEMERERKQQIPPR